MTLGQDFGVYDQRRVSEYVRAQQARDEQAKKDALKTVMIGVLSYGLFKKAVGRR